MRRVLSPTLPKVGQRIEIEAHEAKHLTTVLRVREGDVIELLNGSGAKVQAKIQLQEKRLFVEGVSPVETNPKLNALPIHLRMAILKGDAMEWVIEKAVELGVQKITPLHTDYTVVQIQKKGADTFVERWQKIADQSLKQCGRLERLEIEMPMDLEQTFMDPKGPTFWLDEALAHQGVQAEHLQVALEKTQTTATQPLSLLIGPEGGFSPAERERLLQLTSLNNSEINNTAMKRVHLGALILRAETAALMGISLIAGKIYGKTNS